MFFHWAELLVIPAMIFAFYAQMKVKGSFNKYNRVLATRGYTGAQVARALLDRNRLENIRVELSKGTLSDHYDPSAKAVRLSPEVYHGTSVAALGVAAHEVGHAIQDGEEYFALKLRHNLFPVTRFGSMLAFPLILAGIFLGMGQLFLLGIIFFSFALLFQIVTLPVEFNASSRAMDLLVADGYIGGEEKSATRKVLDAAALTYVAAALVSAMELIKFIIIFMGQREE